MKQRLILAAGVIGLCAAMPSEAWVTINIWQNGPDVAAMGNGFLNLSGLTLVGIMGPTPPQMAPNSTSLYVGNGGGLDAYAGLASAPGPFGPGGTTNAASGTGSAFGVDPIMVWVPNSYASGNLLTMGATWSATNLATLGINPGTYVWSWGSGSTADFVQLNVGAPAPEPETYALFAFGLGAAEWLRRRKRKMLKSDA